MTQNFLRYDTRDKNIPVESLDRIKMEQTPICFYFGECIENLSEVLLAGSYNICLYRMFHFSLYIIIEQPILLANLELIISYRTCSD